MDRASNHVVLAWEEVLVEGVEVVEAEVASAEDEVGTLGMTLNYCSVMI